MKSEEDNLYKDGQRNKILDIEEDLPFLPERMKKEHNPRSNITFSQGIQAESQSGIREFEKESEIRTDSDIDERIDEDDIFSERKYIILIIYDIISNKQRVKMAKLLSSYGSRVQKSAFEARLNKKQYARLLRDIKRMLKQDDNVRIYKLHSYEEILTFGDKKYEIIEDVIII